MNLQNLKANVNGNIMPVASIWWDEKGEIRHIAVHTADSVDTFFGSHEYLLKMIVKEDIS